MDDETDSEFYSDDGEIEHEEWLYYITTQFIYFTAPTLFGMIWFSTQKCSTRFKFAMCVAVGFAWYPVGKGGLFYKDVLRIRKLKQRVITEYPRAHFRRCNIHDQLVETPDTDDEGDVDYYDSDSGSGSGADADADADADAESSGWTTTTDNESEVDSKWGFINSLCKLGGAGLFVAGAAALVLI